MRILHLLSQTELTGAEVYARELIERQFKDGHQVYLISDRFHVPAPIPLHSLPISTQSFWTRMSNILKLRKFLKENQIQVVHCHSRGAARHAYWARLLLKIAQVTTLHGQQHFSWSKRLINIYGELLIAICENVRLAHIRNFKAPQSLFRILRNPFQISASVSRPQITSPRLALLGRSSGPKGQRIEDLGFRCFENWLQKAPNLEISILAPRPERFSQAFQIHLAKLNARFPHQIKVRGQIENLRGELRNYSLNICSGRIAVESLLEGTPVFACGEWNAPGILTEANWPQALASNFGDIGDTDEQLPLNFEEIENSVLNFFKKDSSIEALQSLCKKEFNAEFIHSEVLEIYKAAIFKRHHRAWIPALMYHRIPAGELQTVHRIFVTQDRFEKHLRFFKAAGFTSLSFQDLLEFWDLKKDYNLFPKKPLLLTFDDGYLDNLTHLQPLLLKHQMKATIFLLADHSIVENTWDAATGEPPAALMSLPQKKSLDPKAFEIGSHGFRHLHLNQESPETALKEMCDSRLVLEKDLGVMPVAFAYPFGSVNNELPGLCREAGYRFAVNTDQGGQTLAEQPFSIFRVNIFPEDNAFSLRKKTAPWYRKYFAAKRHQVL